MRHRPELHCSEPPQSAVTVHAAQRQLRQRFDWQVSGEVQSPFTEQLLQDGAPHPGIRQLPLMHCSPLPHWLFWVQAAHLLLLQRLLMQLFALEHEAPLATVPALQLTFVHRRLSQSALTAQASPTAPLPEYEVQNRLSQSLSSEQAPLLAVDPAPHKVPDVSPMSSKSLMPIRASPFRFCTASYTVLMSATYLGGEKFKKSPRNTRASTWSSIVASQV